MTDAEYEHLIAESKRLLNITTATRNAHTKACAEWSIVHLKVEREKTRREIINEYLAETKRDPDKRELEYQLEQAQAGEIP